MDDAYVQIYNFRKMPSIKKRSFVGLRCFKCWSQKMKRWDWIWILRKPPLSEHPVARYRKQWNLGSAGISWYHSFGVLNEQKFQRLQSTFRIRQLRDHAEVWLINKRIGMIQTESSSLREPGLNSQFLKGYKLYKFSIFEGTYFSLVYWCRDFSFRLISNKD